MKKKNIFLLNLIGLLFSAKAVHALPSLQLYIDPALNSGAYYNDSDQTWVYNGGSPALVLSAFALDKDFGSGVGDAFYGSQTKAYLSIALQQNLTPPSGLGDTLPSDVFGTMTIDGVVVPNAVWIYGTPPEATVESMDGAEDLSPHSVFPTWFAEFEFDFGAYGDAVFDTQPGASSSTKTGWRKDFTLDLSGLKVESVHFDLYTLESNGQDLRKFSPYSHDAEANVPNVPPVPEPATLLLLGSGLAGLWVQYKRKKKPI